MEAVVFDALSGEPLRAGRAAYSREMPAGLALVSGPALFDPQVNGFAGVDFHTADLTVDAVEHAVAALWDAGCSHLLPTVTTGPVDRMEAQLAALAAALRSPRVQDAVPGFHVEGPFLSPVEGFRGAHDPACMLDPDPAVYERLQRAAGGRVVMLTDGAGTARIRGVDPAGRGRRRDGVRRAQRRRRGRPGGGGARRAAALDASRQRLRGRRCTATTT